MQVTVPRPDVKGRTEILNWYLSKIKVDSGRYREIRLINTLILVRKCLEKLHPNKGLKSIFISCCVKDPFVSDHLYKFTVCSSTAVNAEIIARGTVGFSGAELENLVNQAALKAAVDEKEMVTMKDLEFAKDKILMGECTQCSDLLCSPQKYHSVSEIRRNT